MWAQELLGSRLDISGGLGLYRPQIYCSVAGRESPLVIPFLIPGQEEMEVTAEVQLLSKLVLPVPSPA